MFNETLELGWVGPNARWAAEPARHVARAHGAQLLGGNLVMVAQPDNGAG